MKTRLISCMLALIILLVLFTSCAQTEKPAEEQPAQSAEPVTLRVVGAWEDFPALVAVADKFTEKYPNCAVVYEYLQDYYASLEKRLESGEDTIDFFVTTNIQSDSALLPYALDMYSAKDISFASTFEGLMYNFELRDAETGTAQLFAVPLGAEIRGMYVNVTLLESLGLAVPTNRQELMDACAVLKENGYVPLQANPGTFAQQLMYPYICNVIANADDYQTAFDTVNTKAPGLSELFREPMEVLYSIVENYYYDYKYVETEYNAFTDSSNEAYARYFLNIWDKDGAFEKVDDVGTVAFMPSAMSVDSTIAKTKSDYHSEINYEFILSPVGEEGGYAYISPAHGIGINKNSTNLEWAAKFISFLFEPENNILFAEKHSIIPNTSDAFGQIEKQFNIPQNHISHLGQVTFDYGFYNLVCKSLVEVSKANNPKYMNTDANGNSVLYDLDYYMGRLEERLQGTLVDE